MTDLLKELRRLAQAATPGPWYRNPKIDGVNSPWGSQLPERSCQIWSDHCISALGCITGATPYPENANFIAAANPQTILALCDALEAAMRGMEQIAGEYDGDGMNLRHRAQSALAEIRKRLEKI